MSAPIATKKNLKTLLSKSKLSPEEKSAAMQALASEIDAAAEVWCSFGHGYLCAL